MSDLVSNVDSVEICPHQVWRRRIQRESLPGILILEKGDPLRLPAFIVMAFHIENNVPIKKKVFPLSVDELLRLYQYVGFRKPLLIGQKSVLMYKSGPNKGCLVKVVRVEEIYCVVHPLGLDKKIHPEGIRHNRVLFDSDFWETFEIVPEIVPRK
ncbi:MAG: hypothetical protein WC444_00205 [Candidatus Paceibacterota bacterium]